MPGRSAAARRVGLIDLGSNSVRLLAVLLRPDGSYRILREAKAVVRLAGDVGQDGRIAQAALLRTVDALRSFQRIGRSLGVTEWEGVATAAVRSAPNGPAFLGAVEAETGLTFRIISGQEEATLSFAGALGALAVEDGVLVDIGGGSTELVRFARRQITAAASIPWGAVNLTKLAGRLRPRELAAHLEETLAVLPWLSEVKGLPLIGVGGTIRALARIDRKETDYPFPVLHGYRMSPERVARLSRSLEEMSPAERRDVPGLSADRAEVIEGGAAMLEVIVRRLPVQELIVSGAGVREGMLGRFLVSSEAALEGMDPLHLSAENLRLEYGLDRARAERTAAHALNLFDSLSELHELGDGERQALWAGTYLAAVGEVVNAWGHEQHAFYLLTRGRLYGLTHRELLFAGLVAGYSSQGKAKGLVHPFRGLLQSGDEERIRKLGVIGALARALTELEPDAVERVSVELSPNLAAFSLTGGANLTAERRGLAEWSAPFEKAFGRSMLIV